MTTLEPRTKVNPAESTEEFVNQIANFRNIQRLWLDKVTYENVLAPSGKTYWDNYADAVDAEVEYTLALKDRMLQEGRYFIETTTHTAFLDDTANSLTRHVPEIKAKQI